MPEIIPKNPVDSCWTGSGTLAYICIFLVSTGFFSSLFGWLSDFICGAATLFLISFAIFLGSTVVSLMLVFMTFFSSVWIMAFSSFGGPAKWSEDFWASFWGDILAGFSLISIFFVSALIYGSYLFSCLTYGFLDLNLLLLTLLLNIIKLNRFLLLYLLDLSLLDLSLYLLLLLLLIYLLSWFLFQIFMFNFLQRNFVNFIWFLLILGKILNWGVQIRPLEKVLLWENFYCHLDVGGWFLLCGLGFGTWFGRSKGFHRKLETPKPL